MSTAATAEPAPKKLLATLERYAPPLLITSILVVGEVAYGILEGLDKTALAIIAAIVTEAVLGRLFLGRFPHLASAYITGISVGILVRSPWVWPFVACSVLSISSKYALRYRGRHLWNPSNLGICLLLLLAPDAVAVLSVQWGNEVWPMAVIWTLGAFIVWRAKRFHVSASYAATFFGLAGLRSLLTDAPFLALVSPITGPMYQLFVLFMITDPRTTVFTRKGRILVAVLVGVVEAGLRELEVVNAPFFSLCLVGPIALVLALRRRPQQQ